MKYKKNGVTVEAFKWTGDHNQTEDPAWITEALKMPESRIGVARIYLRHGEIFMEIKTKEGIIRVKPGEYVIREEDGTLTSSKADRFEANYEEVEEDEKKEKSS